MAELQIDSDWKKQAQEEKRKLAEQAEQKAKGGASAPAGGSGGAGGGSGSRTGGGPGATGMAGGAPGGGTPQRERPAASFTSLVQSLATQALYYLGELAVGSAEPIVDLDLAKHHIDSIGVLETKTRGNLDPAEQQSLDAALYDCRMRFVSIAQQMIR